MRVTVIRRGAMAEIRLRGTALGTARIGEKVAVRAGLGNSIVQGVVRGPGEVELSPEKTK
jgi:flagella basal body P-ring formation protein FlgA